MAIRDLKPYLKSIADKIRSRTVKRNLFDKDNIITFNRYNLADDYAVQPTDTGFSVIAFNANNYIHFKVFFGLAKDLKGKTLTVSTTSIDNAYGVGTNLLINSKMSGDTIIKSGSGWELKNGLRCSSLYIPNDVDYTEEVVCLKLRINNTSSGDKFYIDNLMLSETVRPISYVPYNQESEKVDAQDYCNKIDEIYDTGFSDGFKNFMVQYQDSGYRNNYQGAFMGWKSIGYFRPIYDIKPVRCDNMFNVAGLVIDLPAYLESLGVELDFSNLNNTANSCFNYSSFTRIGDCNFSSAGACASVFTNSNKLVTIDSFTPPTAFAVQANLKSCFTPLPALENIVFKGTILQSISFTTSSKLSVDSMISIITHLADYSLDDTNKDKYTLTLHADAWTRLSEAEQQGRTPQSEGIDFTGTWREYVQTIRWNT